MEQSHGGDSQNNNRTLIVTTALAKTGRSFILKKQGSNKSVLGAPKLGVPIFCTSPLIPACQCLTGFYRGAYDVMYPYRKGSIVLIEKQLAQMKNTDMPVDDRVELAGVRIDEDAPVVSRAEQYLCQIKNPYAFKCGQIAVNVRFSPEGKTLKEAVTSYLSAVKNSN